MNAMKIKHTTNKIKSLAAAMALALFALAGCQQAADGGGTELASAVDANSAYITLGLAGQQTAQGISRTALPDSAGIVFGKFVLSGTSEQEGIEPVSWSCGDGSADASQELSVARVSVSKGAEYTFTLTATTLDGAVYVGVTDPAVTLIDQNIKQLNFGMRFSKATGEGSSGKKGTGEVDVNLPSGGKGGEVNKVTVSLYKLDQNCEIILPPVEGFDEKDVPIEEGKAKFLTGELDAGTYRAVFNLWGGEDSKALLGTWSEDIVIAGGQTSSSTLNPEGGAEGDQVDLAYKITYHLNDDETDPAAVTTARSYSRNVNITLADVKKASSRPNYRIHSWYTDSGLSQEFTKTLDWSQDLDLYASWDECHAINIPTFAHGSATEKPAGDAVGKPAIAGETVTITPTANSGWVVGDITVKGYDKDGQPTGWSQTIARTTASKTFTMPDLPYAGTIGVEVVFLQKFTVTFNENKPANATADSTATSSGSTGPQIFVDGVAQNLTQNGFAIKGWTFAGWNTKADGKGTNYANKASFTTNSATTLYAKWTANTNTKYIVKHWLQPESMTTDKSKYELKATDNSKTGTTWGKTAATANSYTGYETESIAQADHIKADGTTVANVYYKRAYFNINKGPMSNGSVNVATRARFGETVTITGAPNANYSLDTVSVTDSSVSGSGNIRTFKMPAKAVTVNATFVVDLAVVTSDFTIPNGAIVKGELGQNVKICVAEGASITLRGMNIGMKSDGSHKWDGGDYGGLTCLGDATINLADGTVNKIMSIGGGNPGIHIKTGTLVIQGSGTLYAHSHDGGAGIGGGYDNNRKGGNIWIKGGTIDAKGGNLAAGIGSGGRSTIGWIKITGGNVTAVGNQSAAGIGCGDTNIKGQTYPQKSVCGDITISGATVTATKGNGAAHSIGKGSNPNDAQCGNLYINGSLSAYIETSPYTITP